MLSPLLKKQKPTMNCIFILLNFIIWHLELIPLVAMLNWLNSAAVIPPFMPTVKQLGYDGFAIKRVKE